jgi:GxxExxY protein
MELIEAELSERIIGCCTRVHRTLGPGFLEKVYEEALAIELAKGGLGFERQKTVALLYDGKPIGEHRLDYLIEARVVLELKACKDIEDIHLATARSYLKATNRPLALVVNFAKPVIEIRRVILSH